MNILAPWRLDIKSHPQGYGDLKVRADWVRERKAAEDSIRMMN